MSKEMKDAKRSAGKQFYTRLAHFALRSGTAKRDKARRLQVESLKRIEQSFKDGYFQDTLFGRYPSPPGAEFNKIEAIDDPVLKHFKVYLDVIVAAKFGDPFAYEDFDAACVVQHLSAVFVMSYKECEEPNPRFMNRLRARFYEALTKLKPCHRHGQAEVG